MQTIQLRSDDGIFVYRVAGVARREGSVLLHRRDRDQLWALPGGRAQIGETASDALVREMREEIGADVATGKVLWLVENFFDSRPLDDLSLEAAPAQHHELGVCMDMTLPDEFYAEESFRGIEIVAGTEIGLEFKWFEIAALGDLDLRPRVLQLVLAGDPPDGFRTLVQRD